MLRSPAAFHVTPPSKEGTECCYKCAKLFGGMTASSLVSVKHPFSFVFQLALEGPSLAINVVLVHSEGIMYYT